MTRATGDLNTCLCGCGELTSGQWRRGHHSRGEGGYDPARHGIPGTPLPAPPPGGDGDLDDDGLIPVIDPPDPADPAGPPGAHAGRPLSSVPDDYLGRHSVEDPAGLPADPPPAAPRDIPSPRGKHARVTATVRRDIEAKVGIMLEVPGRVWEARDPWCGGAFVAQLPETRAAFADLVCDSPDMVAWFTGVGGGFMKWLNLLVALQPVGTMLYAHHIAHAVGQAADDSHGHPGQVPASSYAA
jgi:hypothetical protein